MRREKGKKKSQEYDFGSVESVRSESDIEPVGKEPLQKRSKSAEKVVKSGNHELRRSNHLKNPINRYGYNEYMVQHYAYMTRVVEVCELESYVEAAKDANWRAAMEEEMRALTNYETWDLVDAGECIK